MERVEVGTTYFTPVDTRAISLMREMAQLLARKATAKTSNMLRIVFISSTKILIFSGVLQFSYQGSQMALPMRVADVHPVTCTRA